MNGLDFIFPPRCFGCQKLGSYFCPDCCDKLTLASFQICPQCGASSWFGKTHASCRTRYSLDGLIGVFAYQGFLREAIKRMKYSPFISCAWQPLTLSANKQIKNQKQFFSLREFLKTKPLVVSIPLSKTRKAWRGYNQAELIGRTLAKEYSLPGTGKLLVRVKNTKPQYLLPQEDRIANIKGAFKVSQKMFPKCRQFTSVLLVDDIATTASTLKEAGRVLKRVGFKKVWGLTLSARR